jgi:hypothetical protein
VVTIPVGWVLFARTRADRFLSAMGLVLLAPTIWSAALGLQIGPCGTPTCVSHTQKNLLILAVAGLVVLALALVALAMMRTVPGAALLLLSCLLTLVGTWKSDRVATIMFAILAASIAAYFVLALLPNKPSPGYPTA